MEKDKALAAALSQIEKSYGKGTVQEIIDWVNNVELPKYLV